MGQRNDGLHGNGVQYGGGDVGLAYVLCDEVLYVSLAENAAPRRYGISAFSLHGEPSKLVNAHVEEHRHLVDERPGAACTVAVHAQVGSPSVTEEHHLGVLSAYVD